MKDVYFSITTHVKLLKTAEREGGAVATADADMWMFLSAPKKFIAGRMSSGPLGLQPSILKDLQTGIGTLCLLV